MKAQKMFGGTKPKETGVSSRPARVNRGSASPASLQGNAHILAQKGRGGVPSLQTKTNIARPAGKEDNRTAWK